MQKKAKHCIEYCETCPKGNVGNELLEVDNDIMIGLFVC